MGQNETRNVGEKIEENEIRNSSTSNKKTSNVGREK